MLPSSGFLLPIFLLTSSWCLKPTKELIPIARNILTAGILHQVEQSNENEIGLFVGSFETLLHDELGLCFFAADSREQRSKAITIARSR